MALTMAHLAPFVNTSLLNIFQRWTGSALLQKGRDVWNSSTDDLPVKRFCLVGIARGCWIGQRLRRFWKLADPGSLLSYKEYRHDPDRFSRLSKKEPDYRLPVRVEKEVERKLMLDKSLTMKSESDWAPVTCTAYLRSD